MSIASEAIHDQRAGSYNTDTWKDIVIPAGTLLYAGYHGAPDYGRYFTDRDTVLAHADGHFAFMLWGILQVRPHASFGDRQNLRELMVVNPCPAAAGSATSNANAYWGGGGGFQFFIPDRFHMNLMQRRVVALNTTGIL